MAAAAAVILVFAGCAGGPDLTSRKVPDWVIAPPAGDSQFEYFVVSSAAADSVAAAEEAAGYSLLTQINQALGVHITVETSAEARSTLDSYEANLVQQVTQSGSGHVEGLRIADRYIAEQGGGFVVYLLGQYERGAFETERSRRQALLRQQEALVTAPEAEGDRLSGTGRITQAIFSYVQAAAAASSSDVQIAPVVLERSLRKAADLANRLELSVVSGPSVVSLGEVPGDPVLFVLRDDRGLPVPGASLEISYLERRGTRDIVRTVAQTTDSDGTTAFFHPAPVRVGEFTVTARLDQEQALSLLGSLPASASNAADVVENAVVNVRVTYRFMVLSRARDVPTAVVILDTDAAGRPLAEDRTSQGVLEALSVAGFQLRSVAVAPAEVASRSVADAIELLQERVPPDVERVILGESGIADFREDDGVLVKVSGSLTAVDLATGTVLYTTSGIKNARSLTAERAIATAFAELGRQLGEDLASNLP